MFATNNTPFKFQKGQLLWLAENPIQFVRVASIVSNECDMDNNPNMNFYNVDFLKKGESKVVPETMLFNSNEVAQEISDFMRINCCSCNKQCESYSTTK